MKNTYYKIPKLRKDGSGDFENRRKNRTLGMKFINEKPRLFIFNCLIFILGSFFLYAKLYYPMFLLAFGFYSLLIVIFIKKIINDKADIVDIITIFF